MRVAFSWSRLLVTMLWERLSRALVASSKIRIEGRPTSALAMRMRWRCPPEMLLLPSEITVCMPMGISAMSSAMPASSAARQASSWVSSFVPTILV